MKSLKPLPSRTPIRTGAICPDAPDIRTLRTMISKKSKEHVTPARGFRASARALDVKLSTSDKIHQKFKSEYNAFMNQLGSLDPRNLGPEALGLLPGLEDPKSTSFLSKEDLGNEVSEKGIVQNSSIYPKGMSIFQPLLPKDVELEDSEIIILKDGNGNRYDKIKEGGPKVFYENDFISYKKARENTDIVIFYLPPEIDEELDALFIAYSKKQIYEEYTESFNSSGSLGGVKNSPLFFVLDLIEEESYHIPMSHIVRILEYPHPMYLIEKSSYSFHIYLTHPCKL
jgi:hypothetical protein